jgi:hypothetical protein
MYTFFDLNTLFVENEGLPKMSKNKNKCKSATENYILKFPTVSSASSDSIVKGIIDDIIKTAVKTEVDGQKTKYLQHFINKHDSTYSCSCSFSVIPHFQRTTCLNQKSKSFK